jgi:hypothetical protein
MLDQCSYASLLDDRHAATSLRNHLVELAARIENGSFIARRSRSHLDVLKVRFFTAPATTVTLPC